MELAVLRRINFAVADNPFFKNETTKFYPECHVISEDGDVIATINPDSKRVKGQFPGLMYADNFRDDKLKINDDRKVKINLNEFTDKGTMILLTVRSRDLRGNSNVKPALYENAWYRLQNEETSQTLDYTVINSVPLPEDYQGEDNAEGGAEQEDGAGDGEAGKRNEIIYLAGRIYRDAAADALPLLDDGKQPTPNWIYERWNQVVTSDAYPNIANTLAGLYCSTKEEAVEYDRRIKQANEAVNRAAEERRQAQLAAMAKKVSKKKGKTKDADADEPDGITREGESKTYENETTGEEKSLDLFVPEQFSEALRTKTPRSFVFGPVLFDKLNLT